MRSHHPQATKIQHAAGAVFAISLVFCSMEMVPGRGIFRPGWPPEVYYVIMALTGGIAGGLIPKNPIAGMPSGALSGVGALLAEAFVLEKVAVISILILCLLGVLGALPGVGLYNGLRLVFFPPCTIYDDTQVVGAGASIPPSELSTVDERDIDPVACPACGGQEFRKKRSEVFLAVLDDRVCHDCGTRYAPPTPRWAGFIYLLCSLMALASAVGCFWWNHIETVRGQLRLGIEVVYGAVLAVAGVLCLGLALRCFFRKGRSKVIDTGHSGRRCG